ncbi:MAG: ABC transporter ATP-binding protein, partial [Gammaproteobacteria bacterium]
LAEIEKVDHPWIQKYSHVPRAHTARGARAASTETA